MKNSRPALLIATLLLAGCAGSSAPADSASSSTWWNPISWSWSSLSPTHWFGSSLQVTEAGVGEVTGSTAMTEAAIGKGLDGNYGLRQGMRSEGGNVVSFWQAINGDKQVKIELSGQGTVSRIDVSDAGVKTAGGVSIGTPFSDLYGKAFGACRKGQGADGDGVECKAPGSEHISYLFSGEWHGPEGLMPADDTLKSWKISKIIWRR
ncbi:RpoE-regulated lipoprotein [Erwinia sp. B116]|uniref:RpoE-regulated lipoprotein n=1 Tax=Erwinia sp. B116 TaxID=1561024 RepID=UPI000C77ECBD|nr:RpoE-regulated lipoprotein [Erwinia sp. B116]PLV63276.1 RpoE-regulated lipoprotein [Erwinia sp. B116]